MVGGRNDGGDGGFEQDYEELADDRAMGEEGGGEGAPGADPLAKINKLFIAPLSPATDSFSLRKYAEAWGLPMTVRPRHRRARLRHPRGPRRPAPAAARALPPRSPGALTRRRAAGGPRRT